MTVSCVPAEYTPLAYRVECTSVPLVIFSWSQSCDFTISCPRETKRTDIMGDRRNLIGGGGSLILHPVRPFRASVSSIPQCSRRNADSDALTLLRDALIHRWRRSKLGLVV